MRISSKVKVKMD